MMGLTIKQPWAHLIAIGHKTIETRTWPTGYRGPLAIHAGLSVDPIGESSLASRRPDLVPAHGFPVGVIVAVADLADCRLLTEADQDAACCRCVNLHGFILADVRRLSKPIPARGRLGLWPAADWLIRAVEDQILDRGDAEARRRRT